MRGHIKEQQRAPGTFLQRGHLSADISVRKMSKTDRNIRVMSPAGPGWEQLKTAEIT